MQSIKITLMMNKVLTALKKGEMIILADDQQRENEGDFVMVAEQVTTKAISFMAEQARTIITLALSPERCEKLGLNLMSGVNGGNPQNTAFTQTIEAAKGITTGSSAQDRVKTIKAAIAKNAKAKDLVSPGHVFPLRAVPGGVLNRAGHTEAACDLAKLAGFEPAGIISEIQLANGKMARYNDLEKIAKQHNLLLTTIAELIAYRTQKESLVKKIAIKKIKTSYGEFLAHYYQDTISTDMHLAIEKKSTKKKSIPVVRVLVNPNVIDYIDFSPPNRSWSVPTAFKKFKNYDSFVLLNLQVNKPNPIITNTSKKQNAGKSQQVRTYGIGAQILRDLDITDMRLLSSPLTLPSMEGFGLNVVEIISGKK